MKQIIFLLFLVLGFQTIVNADNNRVNIKNKSGNTPVKKKLTCTNWSNEEFAEWIESGTIPVWIRNDSSVLYNQDWLKNNYDYRLLTFNQCYRSISFVRDTLSAPMIKYDFSAVAAEIRKFNHYKYLRGQLTGNYRDTTGTLLEVICEPREQYPTFSKEKSETDMIYMGYDLGSDVCHNFRPIPIFIEEVKVDNSSEWEDSQDETVNPSNSTNSNGKTDTSKKLDESEGISQVSKDEESDEDLDDDIVSKKQVSKEKTEMLNKLRAEMKVQQKQIAEAKIKEKEEAKLKAKIKAESDARVKLQAQLKAKAEDVKKTKDKAIALSRAKAEYNAKVKEIKKTFN